MKEERVKILKDNEEYLAKGAKDFETDSEEEVEGEDVEGMQEDSDKEEKEFQDIKKKLAKARQNDKDDENFDDDDEDDSDYEYTAGDLAIYDSALDDVDELLYIKDTLATINQIDQGYFQNLMSGMNQEEFGKFNQNMEEAQALKDREEVVRKQIDELEEKK